MPTMAKTGQQAWTPARFVPLPENRAALLAVRRLARRLTHCPFTPLFLHGPPGTGKTHLANALHEYAAERVEVCRITAADWNPEDADTRRSNLLIVEDLQHLRERMVDDLVKSLDSRLVRKRATLVTASKGPAELSELPARLANRLAAGLVIGLEPLASDSRVILLGNLAKQRKLGIQREVIVWLAAHTPGSARQLAAALTRVEALMFGLPRPVEVADVVADFEGHATAKTDVEAITRHVGREFDVSVKALRGRGRQPQILWPRQVSMYLTRRLTEMSLAQIGEYFGRDHSTVRHACQKVEEALATDAELPALVRRWQAELT